MSKLRTTLKIWKRFLSRNHTSAVWILAVLFLALSYMNISNSSPVRKAVQVEKKLHKREKIMQEYVDKAFMTPPDQWLSLEDFPDDMVLYKYVADTLQSWANLFPISNDEVDFTPTWYRIHDLKNRNLFNTPLAFLKDSVQYVNFGYSWYIVKTYKKDNVKIICGIEIIKQYYAENAVLKNSYNKHIGLDERYTTVPTYIDDSSIVHTLDGNASFSIVSVEPLSKTEKATGFRWIALIMAIIALFMYQSEHNCLKNMWLTLTGLAILQSSTYLMVKSIPDSIEILSPILYADSYMFDSLGKMILTHLYLFLYAASIYLSRNVVLRNILSSEPKKRKLKVWILVSAAIMLSVYTALSLVSLILNSTITLDLYRINVITFHTVIIYCCYGLLFTALLFLLYIILSIISPRFNRYRKKHPQRIVIAYTSAVSLSIILMITYSSFKKEEESMRVLTSRIATERDLGLEIQLQTIEKNIMADPMIKAFTGTPYSESMILNRLVERYFWNILPNYQLRISVCTPFDRISTEEYVRPVNCFHYFSGKIREYGIKLSKTSAFYYLDYFNDNINYLGAFNILKGDTRYDFYLEIESKRTNDNTGYPSSLLDDNTPKDKYLKHPYSTAKYLHGKLTVNKGQYNFPVSVDPNDFPLGFSYQTEDDYIFFVDKLPNNNIVIVTRPGKNFLLHLLSFSYTFLFFSMVFFLIPRLFKRKKTESLLSIPRKSFRLKMIIFPTASLVIALIFMAISSVILIMEYIDNNRLSLMEEKLLSVQNTFSQTARTSERFTEINTAETFNAMELVSRNAQVDINLFDPLGKLIRTTKPEIFNEYIVSSRMDPKAYYELVYNKKMQVIQEESISNLKYYSLYSPIYNERGTLLAVANIPYFVSDTVFEHDASPIIAGIVNIYIILIIAAVLISITMSNSVTKPLKEISKKLEDMDISHKPEHINYKSEDELGMLVKTYNNMIDALDKSTKELAQSEREEAWREMARQIAHEIKNPLTPMKLSIQHLIRMKRQNVPDWQERFDTLASSLIEQIDILSNTASEFSSFAKFYTEEVSNVDLVALLYEQRALFDNYENISISFRRNEERAVVKARKGQITRAFVNLISNAVQAVEHKDNGKIIITLYRDGNYYRTDVEDNGSGVSDDNLKKLFSPNFTTKTKGTGLGLAISKNIVTQSQGEIFYSNSEEMGGACFSIKLPVPPDFGNNEKEA